MLRSTLLAFGLFVLTWLMFAATAAAGEEESLFDGHWQGAIELPTGELAIDVDLQSDDAGAITGDISIPAQAAKDVPLIDIEATGRSLRFQISGVPGDPTFDGTLSADGTGLTGTFAQGPSELRFHLSRGESSAQGATTALDGFDAIADQAIKDFNVPGLGIAIVAGGEVVYAKGFGLRDVEAGLPMTPDTLFAIGSTTKAMTATVLGMLVDDGKLDWDQPLVRYLPSFRLADPMITARITPRDLVTHRSGLPRHDLLWYNFNDGSRADVIPRLAHLELTADLRERFQYNNLMFMTAGYLAGHLDGSSWESVVRKRLFEPLGMTRSNFAVADSQEDADHALPYEKNDDDQLERIPFRSIDLIGPAGSVNASVNEMARWLQLNLAGGKVGDRQLIQSSTLADIHSPHMTLDGPPDPTSMVSQGAYGMGWGVEIYRGHRRIQHGGGIDGFITSVMFFPDDDLGLVAFTNRGSGLASLVNQTAADRILGLDSVDWLGDALTRAEQSEAIGEAAEAKKDATRIDNTQPSRTLPGYVGTYRHPGYGDVTVRLDSDQLTAVFNAIETPLEHWHYDVFHGAEAEDDATFEGMAYQFRADFDGQIAELVVPFEATAKPIVFARQADPRLHDPGYLQQLVATYVGETGQRARIELSGTTLTVHLPGQPTYTLVPQVSGRFAIEGLQGFGVGFSEDGSKLTFYQPNGVFESTRVTDE